MDFRDPISAYIAATNDEAHTVCALLIEAGIEARVVEDQTPAGAWLLGWIPGIHRPEVWIDRADSERAGAILAEYEQKLSERNYPDEHGAQIEVICEDCGKPLTFPAVLKGTVDVCRHCGAFVDVGEQEALEGWDEAGVEASSEEPAETEEEE